MCWPWLLKMGNKYAGNNLDKKDTKQSQQITTLISIQS